MTYDPKTQELLDIYMSGFRKLGAAIAANEKPDPAASATPAPPATALPPKPDLTKAVTTPAEVVAVLRAIAAAMTTEGMEPRAAIRTAGAMLRESRAVGAFKTPGTADIHMELAGAYYAPDVLARTQRCLVVRKLVKFEELGDAGSFLRLANGLEASSAAKSMPLLSCTDRGPSVETVVSGTASTDGPLGRCGDEPAGPKMPSSVNKSTPKKLFAAGDETEGEWTDPMPLKHIANIVNREVRAARRLLAKTGLIQKTWNMWIVRWDNLGSDRMCKRLKSAAAAFNAEKDEGKSIAAP